MYACHRNQSSSTGGCRWRSDLPSSWYAQWPAPETRTTGRGAWVPAACATGTSILVQGPNMHDHKCGSTSIRCRNPVTAMSCRSPEQDEAVSPLEVAQDADQAPYAAAAAEAEGLKHPRPHPAAAAGGAAEVGAVISAVAAGQQRRQQPASIQVLSICHISCYGVITWWLACPGRPSQCIRLYRSGDL